MRIHIDGNDYQVPVSLKEITLADRISYDKTYGADFRDRLKAILEEPEGLDRDLALAEYQCDLAVKTLSFFGKIPLVLVQNTRLEHVLIIYHECLKALAEDINYQDETFQLVQEIEWNGELWEIAPPELKGTSGMTFDEFLDAKQVVKNLFELGNDRWEALLALCCIYLRKKGEKYNESLKEEGGERYQLMQTLPLEYALHVGFFLSVSMSTYINTFRSSIQPENAESLS